MGLPPRMSPQQALPRMAATSRRCRTVEEVPDVEEVPAQYPRHPSDGHDVEEVLDLQQGSFDEVRDLTDTLDNGNRIILAHGLGEGLAELFLVKKMPRAGECGLQNLNEVFALLGMAKEELPGVHKASHVFKDADHLYVFMELCTGGDLFNHVDEVLNEQALRTWATKLLQVLQVLHRSGRVHGDVCLENLVVDDKSSTLKIIDCAQMISVHAPGDTHNEALVPRDRVTGRTFLRPPETVNPPDGAGSSAKKRDIYQAACTIFALATKNYPFTMWEALRAPREQLPTGGCAASVRKLGLHLPYASPELQDLMGRLLAPDPDMRLTAAEALAHPWIAGPAA